MGLPPLGTSKHEYSAVVGAAELEIVHGRERGELAVAQAMASVMVQGQLAVSTLHAGVAALKQVGALAGHLFEPLTVFGCKRRDRVVGLARRLEQLRAQCPQAVPGLGAGAANGSAIEIERPNELLDQGGIHRGRQIEGLDFSPARWRRKRTLLHLVWARGQPLSIRFGPTP